MIACSAPPVWPTRSAPYHSATASKYGADEPIDVVADPVRQLGRVLDDEPGAAVQRAPDPEGDRERVAALDRPVARAEQPERGPRAGGEHQVARQRRAVPARAGAPPRARVMPGPQAGQQLRTPLDVWHAAHSNAASCSTSLMTRSPSAGSISRSVGVLDERRAGPIRPRSSSTRKAGASIVARLGVRLPADDADPAARPDALVARGSPRAAATGRAAGRAG